MATQATQEKGAPTARLMQGLGPAALILLLAYLLVMVLQHSDVELIHPETRVDLGKLFEKLGEGIPSGSIVTPLLGLKLSVFHFYLLGPLFVLSVHIYLLQRDTLASLADVRFVQRLAIYLPAVLVFSMSWRFAPYAKARPLGGAYSIGEPLTWFHATVLLLDAIVLVYMVLGEVALHTSVWPVAGQRWRNVTLAATVTKLVGTLGLVALSLWWLLGSFFTEIEQRVPLGSPWLITVPVALLWWRLRPFKRHARNGRTAPLPSVNLRYSGEILLMHVGGLLAIMVTAAVILPTYGRVLDLSDAKLVAAEPSEAMLAALIAHEARATGAQTTPHSTAEADLTNVRVKAWQHFGRGLDYSDWRFPGVSFQGALMPLIKLERADLRGANLIRANLTRADLRQTWLEGTQLSEANLRQAQLIQAQGVPKTGDASAKKLRGVNLAKAELQGANLTNADFRWANMEEVMMDQTTTLAEANFTEANFKGAKLRGVKFADADIHGADFCAADLRDADLSMVKNAAKAKFHHANLAGATFSGDLEGADFTGANIDGMMITGDKRNLKWAVFKKTVQAPDFPLNPQACKKEN